jgi:hypothetical protein
MAMTTTKAILLEFNELTPTLMDQFISEGHLPYFKRFRDEAQLFLTDAGEEARHLEPWIQWVTVHSGLTFGEHGLFHLDEGHTLKAKRVWDVLSDAGYGVFVCGSMNVRYDADLRGSVLPDPWCTQVPPKPDEFNLYFRFVQQNVLEYSNSRIPLSTTDYLRFASFMATHGLSPSTVLSIVKQLASERGGHNRWKRAALLDQLQCDLFCSYYRRYRPQFSTFFLNSTAHYQHSYWRSMEPEVFLAKASAEEQAEYESAILFGYQKMDEILGRFMALAGRDVTLVFCTALSQQPCLKYEAQGGATFHRPTDFRKLADFAGLRPGFAAAPVMTHQFNLQFASEADAVDAEAKLRAVLIDGREALSVERTGNHLVTGSQTYRAIAESTRLTTRDGSKTIPFFDIFYKLDTIKSGMHHPDGMLWIRTPARVHSRTIAHVPLTAVAPTLLNMFNVARPAHMKRDPIPVQ